MIPETLRHEVPRSPGEHDLAPRDLSGSEIIYENDESINEALDQPDSITAVKSLRRQGFDINYHNGYQGHILTIAAIMHPRLVTYLLSEGADPNVKSNLGTPLSVAADSSGVPPSTVAELLSHGAQTQGSQALHKAAYAASSGCTEKVKLLLKHGADPNAVFEERGAMLDRMLDRNGPLSPYGTALHEAAGAHYAEKMYQGFRHTKCIAEEQAHVIELLLEHGADPRAKDSRGRLPIDWVTEGPLYKEPTWKQMESADGEPVDCEKHLQRLKALLTQT